MYNDKIMYVAALLSAAITEEITESEYNSKMYEWKLSIEDGTPSDDHAIIHKNERDDKIGFSFIYEGRLYSYITHPDYPDYYTATTFAPIPAVADPYAGEQTPPLSGKVTLPITQRKRLPYRCPNCGCENIDDGLCYNCTFPQF